MMARIKIKDQDRRPEFSIAVVISAAVAIWFAVMLWSSSIPVTAVQRDLTQIPATYVCDDGHRFLGVLDVRSRSCAVAGCEQRAWPLWSYQCTKDGSLRFQLRYERTRQDRPRIKSVRPLGGQWQQVAEEVHCPHCGRGVQPDVFLDPDPQSQPISSL